jgi:hypothetical protein
VNLALTRAMRFTLFGGDVSSRRQSRSYEVKREDSIAQPFLYEQENIRRISSDTLENRCLRVFAW